MDEIEPSAAQEQVATVRRQQAEKAQRLTASALRLLPVHNGARRTAGLVSLIYVTQADVDALA